MTDNARNDILIAGVHDWVSLAESIGFVSDEHPGAEGREVWDRLLDLLSSMMADGSIEIGSLSPRFVSWGLSREKTLEVLERDWRGVAENPGLGMGVWISLTESGESEGQRLYDDLPDPSHD